MSGYNIHSTRPSIKVLDEITGFARSRHPVKVHCYQWTTSNYKRESIRPLSNSAIYESPFGMLSKVSQHYKIHTPKDQNVSGNIGSCQKEKNLYHGIIVSQQNHFVNSFLKLFHGFLIGCLEDLTSENTRV